MVRRWERRRQRLWLASFAIIHPVGTIMTSKLGERGKEIEESTKEIGESIEEVEGRELLVSLRSPKTIS